MKNEARINAENADLARLLQECRAGPGTLAQDPEFAAAPGRMECAWHRPQSALKLSFKRYSRPQESSLPRLSRAAATQVKISPCWKAWRRSACARPCISARPGSWACTI